jgi:hypothetical protein
LEEWEDIKTEGNWKFYNRHETIIDTASTVKEKEEKRIRTNEHKLVILEPINLGCSYEHC